MREIVKKHRLAVCMLVLWILFEIISLIVHWTGVYAFTIRITLLTVLGISLFWLPTVKHGSWRGIVTISIPLIALSVSLLSLVNTSLADRLAYEDGLIEWLSAILLFLATIVMLVFAFKIKNKKNMKLVMWIAITFSLMAFIVGMEEVSWMQRIFETETPAVLDEINAQGEINFHNISTTFFESSYYIGGFVLLTLLPFIYIPLKKWMSNSLYFKNAATLLPHSWLIIPFSVISGFSKNMEMINTPQYDWLGVWAWVLYIILVIFTIIILIAKIESQRDVSSLNIVSASLALVSISVSFIVFFFMNYGESRSWFASEYREFFIALGIAVYSFDVLQRYNESVKSKNFFIDKVKKLKSVIFKV